MKLTIEVGEEMFRFGSFQNWVDKAKGWFARSGVDHYDHVCIDARGRLCRYGVHFRRAAADGAYPIVVYRCDAEPEVTK